MREKLRRGFNTIEEGRDGSRRPKGKGQHTGEI